MRVAVTRHDIDRGHPDDECRCPVALAIRREVGIPTSVGGRMIVIDYATPWQTEIWSPEAVADFVEAFDAGEQVEPFGFDLPFYRRDHEERRRLHESAAAE